MESRVPVLLAPGDTVAPGRARSHRRRARSALRSRLRGLPLVAVLALLTLLALKIEFKSPNSNDAFYAYGLTVTAVISITMTVSFAFYRDQALVARVRRPELDLARSQPSGSSPAGSPPPVRWPLVSCIVAVHNEEVLVRQCLASMAAQTYPNTELIVIDDASTDNTAAVLRELAARYPITLIELPENRGKKGALAVGVLESSGTVIAFADSDTVWARDALAMAIPIFITDEDVGAVSGHCRALNGDTNILTKIQDSWYEGQFSVRKAFESVFSAVTCVSGPLAFFRRSAIYNFMPAWEADTFLGQEFRFATDRTLTAYVLGGRYLGPRVLPRHSESPFAVPGYPIRDWKIVYSKSTRAWTNVPDKFGGMIKQQIRWKKSLIRNVPVTGRFYWRRPLLPALFYYVHVAFAFAGPFVAARHLIYLPLHGDPMSMLLYLAGIATIGLSFGLAFRHENPSSRRWLYRPLMSLMSTLLFSWLIFYSAATIKRMTWFRG
jgi:cellulose synthase/poly-beta-1,6-N-acetylglucosamine synthase-like glycosyltransferase